MALAGCGSTAKPIQANADPAGIASNDSVREALGAGTATTSKSTAEVTIAPTSADAGVPDSAGVAPVPLPVPTHEQPTPKGATWRPMPTATSIAPIRHTPPLPGRMPIRQHDASVSK
jgi:hypothetical protein